MKLLLLCLSIGWASYAISQTVIWTNNFDNPADWVVDNDGQIPPDYGWSIDPNENSWWANTVINSSSEGNFAEVNNGDPTLFNEAQGVTYTLATANPINIPALPLNSTSTDHVSLQFEQYGASFTDQQLVQVSTDGIVWTTVRYSSIKSY